MTVSVVDSGSVTPTVGTESTLTTQTTAGIYTLNVDCSNMVGGDTVLLRVYGKARSTDTEGVIYRADFSNLQNAPLKVSIAYATPHYIKCTLTQTAGTARAFPWALYSL